MRKSRRFEMTYSVIIPKPPNEMAKLEVWTPFPCATVDQEVHSVEVKTTMPYEVRYDSVYGNAILHATADISDQRGLELIIRTKASRYERSVNIGDYDACEVPIPSHSSPFRAQLTENRLIRFSPDILNIATKIKRVANNTLETARAAYAHVLENMKYDKTGEGWGKGDAEFACSISKGNCTDFHSLFLAIIRACEIPGQFEIGMAFPSGILEGDITAYKCGYHCWTSFFMSSVGWVPVDCSEAAQKPELRDYYFGNLDENRFLLSYGRDIDLPGRSGREPVNFFTEPVIETSEGARVDYEKTLTFRNF